MSEIGLPLKPSENNYKTENKKITEPQPVKNVIELPSAPSPQTTENPPNDISSLMSKGKASAIKAFLELGKEIPSEKAQSFIEGIRNTKGTEKFDALINFSDNLNKMDKGNVKAVRDYLVTAMADPKNKDDVLLGSLLGEVNENLDSRGKSVNISSFFNQKFTSIEEAKSKVDSIIKAQKPEMLFKFEKMVNEMQYPDTLSDKCSPMDQKGTHKMHKLKEYITQEKEKPNADKDLLNSLEKLVDTSIKRTNLELEGYNDSKIPRVGPVGDFDLKNLTPNEDK